jgi:hypothetical protein
MRWTHTAGRNCCATSGGCADGEVVWSWRSDAGAKFRRYDLRGDGGNQAWSPGRSRISRKTIAQGRPDDPPVPVVLPRAFCCTRAMGAVGTRPSLRPLIFEGETKTTTRTPSAPRDCGFMFSCLFRLSVFLGLFDLGYLTLGYLTLGCLTLGCLTLGCLTVTSGACRRAARAVAVIESLPRINGVAWVTPLDGAQLRRVCSPAVG